MLEPTLEPNRPLLERAVHLANGRRQVLRTYRIDDLVDADTECREVGRPDVDVELRAVAADDVHLCDTANRTQVAGDSLVGELRELGRG